MVSVPDEYPLSDTWDDGMLVNVCWYIVGEWIERAMSRMFLRNHE